MAKRQSVLCFLNTRLKNHPAPEHPAKPSKGFARPEAVARALGYTDREQAVAKDVLGQFVWRHAAPPDATVSQTSAAQPPEEDANNGAEDERALDDLDAAS